MYKAIEVANWFIWRVNTDMEGIGDNISNLKLQKLLYYAQGFSLALNGKPLFEEPLVNWPHGPVVVDVYEEFKVNGAQALAIADNFDPGIIEQQDQDLLEDVWTVYGQYSAWGLRNLTHEEAPWKETSAHDVIHPDSIRKFFQAELIDG